MLKPTLDPSIVTCKAENGLIVNNLDAKLIVAVSTLDGGSHVFFCILRAAVSNIKKQTAWAFGGLPLFIGFWFVFVLSVLLLIGLQINHSQATYSWWCYCHDCAKAIFEHCSNDVIVVFYLVGVRKPDSQFGYLLAAVKHATGHKLVSFNSECS